VARLYIENMAAKELAKLFYIVNTFIFEENGKKNREKWQFGAELIGMGSPLADVELIVLALEILEKLGLGNVELKLSHAGLTRGILQKLGMNQEEQHQVFDKLLDGDASVLNQLQAERPGLAPLLALQGQSSGFVKNLAAALTLDLPELKPQIDDLVFIADTLQSLGRSFRIDIASVRGFEYYTGAIFQLFINDEKVGGGGRYDDLITAMGGKPTPASGFALYLDLLMKLIDNDQLKGQDAPKVLVKMDADAANMGFGLADLLRNVGYTVKLHLGGKGPADVGWKLEVHHKAPLLVLTDLKQNKRYEMQTSEEVLEKLGR
jgi:histidyl-tRNA synthetase